MFLSFSKKKRYKKRHLKTHIANPYEETQEEAALARPPGDIDKELFDAAVRGLKIAFLWSCLINVSL